MDNLGRRGRGEEVQHVPRVSNMECVLGVLIMEEEEKVGGKALKVLNVISPKCTFLCSVIINLYFFLTAVIMFAPLSLGHSQDVGNPQ